MIPASLQGTILVAIQDLPFTNVGGVWKVLLDFFPEPFRSFEVVAIYTRPMSLKPPP